MNLSDLMEGADQLRKMLDLQSLGERILWDLSNYWWHSSSSSHIILSCSHQTLSHLGTVILTDTSVVHFKIYC